MLTLQEAYKKNDLKLISANPYSDFKDIIALTKAQEIKKGTLKDLYLVTLIDTGNYSEFPPDCKTEQIEDYTFTCVFESQKNKREFADSSPTKIPTEIFFRVYKIETIFKRGV